MYAAFRENKENLPGDEDILKTNKPTLKINLIALKTDDPSLQLKSIVPLQIFVPPEMTMEILKKYLVSKLDDNSVGTINEIDVIFKNQKMRDDLSFKNIDSMFKFNDDNIIFYYMRKENKNTN
jgi:hypothetical protein